MPASSLTRFLPPIARQLARKRAAREKAAAKIKDRKPTATGKDRRKRDRITIEQLNKLSEKELQELGEKAKEKQDVRPTYVKALDWLDVPRNAVFNVIGSLAGVDKEKVRKGTFMPKVYASDVLEKLGWKGKSTGTRVARGAVGFMADVALDPLTYLSAGATTGAKVIKGAPKILGAKSIARKAANAMARGQSVSGKIAKAFGKTPEQLARMGSQLTKRVGLRKAVKMMSKGRKGKGTWFWNRMQKSLAGTAGDDAAKAATKFVAKHGEQGRTLLRVPFMKKGLTLPGRRRRLWQAFKEGATGLGEAGAASKGVGAAASAAKQAGIKAAETTATETAKLKEASQAVVGTREAAKKAIQGLNRPGQMAISKTAQKRLQALVTKGARQSKAEVKKAAQEAIEAGTEAHKAAQGAEGVARTKYIGMLANPPTEAVRELTRQKFGTAAKTAFGRGMRKLFGQPNSPTQQGLQASKMAAGMESVAEGGIAAQELQQVLTPLAKRLAVQAKMAPDDVLRHLTDALEVTGKEGAGAFDVGLQRFLTSPIGQSDEAKAFVETFRQMEGGPREKLLAGYARLGLPAPKESALGYVKGVVRKDAQDAIRAQAVHAGKRAYNPERMKVRQMIDAEGHRLSPQMQAHRQQRRASLEQLAQRRPDKGAVPAGLGFEDIPDVSAGKIARRPTLEGVPIEGSEVLVQSEPAITARVARNFPVDVPGAHYFNSIILQEGMRGRGIGQQMFMDSLGQIPKGNWVFSSQLEHPAAQALNALEKKGLVEVWSFADRAGKPSLGVARSTLESGEDLGAWIARLSDKGRDVAGAGAQAPPSPASLMGLRGGVRDAIGARPGIGSPEFTKVVRKGGATEAQLGAEGWQKGATGFPTSAQRDAMTQQGNLGGLVGDAYRGSLYGRDPARSLGMGIAESRKQTELLGAVEKIMPLSMPITPQEVGGLQARGLGMVDQNLFANHPLNGTGVEKLFQGKAFPQPVKELFDDFLRSTANPKEVHGILKATDKALQFWKGFALFHPAYTIRNSFDAVLGGMFAGVRPDRTVRRAMSKKTHAVTNALVNGSNLSDDVVRFAGGNASSKEVMLALRGTNMGNAAMASEMFYDSLTGAQRVGKRMNWLTGKWFYGNNWLETNNRVAIWMELVDQGNSFGQASQKVLKAMPDLSNLTVFERTVGKRVFPWYAWMRRNGERMVRLLAEQPAWMAGSGKLQHSLEEAFVGADKVPEELRPKWMQEQQAFQMAGDSKEGHMWLLASWLPFQDLVKIASGTMSLQEGARAAVEQMRPEIKFVAEQATGHDIFRRQELADQSTPQAIKNIFPALLGRSGTPLDNVLAIRPVKEYGKRVWEMPTTGAGIARGVLGGAIQPVNRARGLQSENIAIREQMMKVRGQINRAREAGDQAALKNLMRLWIQLNARASRLGLPTVAKRTQQTLSQFGLPQGEPAFAQ